MPYDHYFLIILRKLLSSGEFGLDGPGVLFPYFIFVCYDFHETLGILRKLGISALNMLFYCFDTPAKRLVSLSSSAFKSQIFMVENSH